MAPSDVRRLEKIGNLRPIRLTMCLTIREAPFDGACIDFTYEVLMIWLRPRALSSVPRWGRLLVAAPSGQTGLGLCLQMRPPKTWTEGQAKAAGVPTLFIQLLRAPASAPPPGPGRPVGSITKLK